MHMFTVALGIGAIALSFGTAHAVSLRGPYVGTFNTVVVATIEPMPDANALPIEIASANEALPADYSWQRWAPVTDF